MGGGGALDAVVAAALEEGVPQVAEVGDDALQLRLAQHAQIPLAQVLAAWRLLPARVAVQDVVIPLHVFAQPLSLSYALVCLTAATQCPGHRLPKCHHLTFLTKPEAMICPDLSVVGAQTVLWCQKENMLL